MGGSSWPSKDSASRSSTPILQVTNSSTPFSLGDSGSVLLRLAAVHHYSTPQTHSFNTPYQLSIIPPRMRTQASIFGGSYLEDLPRDAVTTALRMQHGDVLVLATDGVFDNLNNQDILKIISGRMLLTGAWTATPELGVAASDTLYRLTRPGGLAHILPPQSFMLSSKPSQQSTHSHSTSNSSSTSSSPRKKDNHTSHPPPPPPPSRRDVINNNQRPQTAAASFTLQSLLAAAIAGEAKLASIDLRRDGPFAKEAQRYYPSDWYRGGKVDDICVLVVVAVEEGREEGGAASSSSAERSSKL